MMTRFLSEAMAHLTAIAVVAWIVLSPSELRSFAAIMVGAAIVAVSIAIRTELLALAAARARRKANGSP